MRPPGPLYWDSFGYVEQALRCKVGGLGLGRPLFVLFLHAVTRVVMSFGTTAAELERALALACLLVSAFVAPLTAMYGSRVGLGRHGAMAAGIVVATSPLFAHTTGSVLTEGPSMVLAMASLVVATARVRQPALLRWLLAGALVGGAVAMREQAIYFLPATLLHAARERTRWRTLAVTLVGFALVLGGAVGWFAATQDGYAVRFVIWRGGVAHEVADAAFMHRTHDIPLTLAGLLALGPVAIVLAATAFGTRTRQLLGRARGPAPLVLASVALLATLLVVPDVALRPRYFCLLLPGLVAIPAGLAVARLSPRIRPLLAVAAALPLLASAPWVNAYDAQQVAATRETRARIASLPPTALLVTGRPCASLVLDNVIASYAGEPKVDVARICAGWAWPANLRQSLDEARRKGAYVVVDMREGAWTPVHVRERREAAAYLEQHGDIAILR